MGTRFLATPESGAHHDYVAALLAAGDEATVLTTAFSVGWPDAPHRVLASALAAAEGFEGAHVGTLAVDGEPQPLPRFSARTPSREVTGAVAAMALYAGQGGRACQRDQGRCRHRDGARRRSRAAPTALVGVVSEQAADERLAQARAAVSRVAWIEAYDLLSDLDRSGALSADDLGDLARACHWTGRMDECLGAWERAYGLYLEASETRRAGVAALELVRWHRHKLAPAVATGWLRRAERLLADDPECVEYGYLQLRRASDAMVAGDLGALARARTGGAEIGHRFGDRDLELMAQHEHGVMLVQQGDLSKALR